MSKVQIISDDRALASAFNRIAEHPVVGVDIETTALDPRSGDIRLVQLSVPEAVDGASSEVTFVIDMKAFVLDLDRFTALRELICNPDVVKVAHNAKFELKWFMHHLSLTGSRWMPAAWYDTMLAEQLILADRVHLYKLSDLVSKYLGWTMDKTLQLSDWSAECLMPEQINYAAKDAEVMLPIREIQVKRLLQEDLLRVAYIEFDAIAAIADVELKGLRLCANSWATLLKKKTEERDVSHTGLLSLLQQGVDWTERNPEKVGTRPVKPKNKPAHPTRSKAGKIYASMVGVDAALAEYEGAMKDYTARLAEYELEIEEWKRLPEQVDASINLSSPLQVKAALANLGVPLPLDRETGKPSTREYLILPLEADYPAVRALIDFRGKEKSVTSYGQNWLDKLGADSRIHPDFEQIGAPTGRMACIAEGQGVSVPSGQKNIEDIRTGDYVYCYTDDGRITLRRVMSVMDNGVQECVRVKWQSSGKGDVGELICTPDHLLKTKHRGWVRADQLRRYDKVLHLRHSKQKNGRVRLYGANGYMEFEEACIKREYFGAESSLHIHHKDRNKANNVLSNFEVLTNAEHGFLHSVGKVVSDETRRKLSVARRGRQMPRGENSAGWIDRSRFQLLRALARTKGRPTKVGMAFETFKNKCGLTDIPIAAVRLRYGVRGKYLSRGVVASAFSLGTAERAAKSLGIGTRKLKEVCAEYGLSYNHAVTSVKPCGTRRVFDLEIEEHHNFIAGELCVHNCRNPNVQQVPSDEAHRRCFAAPKGKVLVISDYSQIELRILAEFSGDKLFCKAFNEGLDLHQSGASIIFGVAYDAVTKQQRKFAKNLNFGLVYGIGAKRYAAQCSLSLEVAQGILRKYFNTYTGNAAWLEAAERQGMEKGFARTAAGRLWRMNFDRDDAGEKATAGRNAKNCPIQGTAADLFKEAVALVWRRFRLLDFDAGIVNLVHDEIVTECEASIAERVKEVQEEAMCEVGRAYIKRVPVEVETTIGTQWAKG